MLSICTWTGGGADAKWSTAANWSGGVAPTAGDSLVFAGTTRTSSTNDLAAGTSFASIEFQKGNFTLAGNSIALSGGVTVDSTATTTDTISLNVALGGSATTVDVEGTALSVSGTVSGSSGLSKAGAGTLTLSGSNSYSGSTTIAAGALNIRNSGALGSGTAVSVVNNARLEMQGGITVSGKTLALDGNGGNMLGALESVGGTTNTWDGAIALATTTTTQARIGASGPDTAHVGTLVVTGAISGGSASYGLGIRATYDTSNNSLGTVVLQGASTYAGPTQIVVGTLVLDAGDNRLPTGTVLSVGNTSNVGTSTLDLAGHSQQLAGLLDYGTTMVRTVTNSVSGTSGTLTVNGTGTTTYAGVISGNVGLVKSGTGTEILTGSNTYSGTTTVSAGVLNIQNASALAAR